MDIRPHFEETFGRFPSGMLKLGFNTELNRKCPREEKIQTFALCVEMEGVGKEESLQFSRKIFNMIPDIPE